MPGSNLNRLFKKALAPLWYALPDSRATAFLVEAKRRARVVVRKRLDHVGIDRIHLGGTIGHPARDFAELIGIPSWPSTRLIDGPHVDLYRRFQRDEPIPGPGEELSEVAYVDLALRCIDGAGEFCECTDLGQVLDLIEWRRSLWLSDAARTEVPVAGPALVRPIRGSDALEIVDGHHRLARAWVRGRRHVAVDVTWSTAPPLEGSDPR